MAPVEAQAAGLPVVMSTHIPTEAIWRPELVRCLELEDPKKWVAALSSLGRRRAVPEVSNCSFDIHRNLKTMTGLYRAAECNLTTRLAND